VDPDLLRRLESLTGLACDDGERVALARDLREMVRFVERLDVPLDGDADAQSHETDVVPTREDVPQPSLPPADALSAAPAVADGCFLTPPVRPRGGDDD